MSTIVELLEQQKESNVYLDLLSETVDTNNSISDNTDNQNRLMSELVSTIVDSNNSLKNIGNLSGDDSKEELFNMLDDRLSESNMHLKTLSDSSQGVESIMKNNEYQEDVGGLSNTGIGSETGDKKLKKGGLLGSLGSLFGLKGLPKGGLMGGVFSKLGKMLESPKIFGKVLGKGGIKGLAKGAGKLLGPISAVAIGLFEFTKGLQNASEIVGKSKEEISDLELAGAGLAGVISGITFGLIDAKTVFKGIDSIGNAVKGWSDDIYNMLPDAEKGLVDALSDFFFDKEDGILGGIGEIFAQPIRALSEGRYLDAIIGEMLIPMKMMYSLIKRWSGKGVDAIKSVFEFDWASLLTIDGIMDFANNVGSKIMSGLSASFDMLMSGVSVLGNSLWEGLGPEIRNDLTSIGTWIKDKVIGVFNPIKDVVVNIITPVVETVSGIFTSVSETISGAVNAIGNVFTSIGDFFTSIPSMISSYVKESVSGLPFGLGEKLGSLFGSDEKKEATPSNVVDIKKYSDKEIGTLTQMNATQKKVPMEKASSLGAIPLRADAKTATNYSKERLDKKQESSGNAPVIINNNNGGKQQSAPIIPRRGSVDDLAIGFMNSGALDG